MRNTEIIEKEENSPKQEKIECYGVKSLKNTKFRKIFKNAAAAKKWADDNNAEIHGWRNIQDY